MLAAFITDLIADRLFHPKEYADLLLSRLDGIGDFVVWQDSLRAFRGKYAHKKVVLVCSAEFYALARMDSFFSKVIPVDRALTFRNLICRLKFLRELRQTAFHEVISPAFMHDVEIWEWVVRMSVGARKIGMTASSEPNEKSKDKSVQAYTQLVDVRELSNALHVNARFVCSILQPDFSPALPKLDFFPKTTREQPSCVVFAFGATDELRKWPASKFTELASHLECPIILLGRGKKDARSGEFLLQRVPRSGRVRNLINRTTLPEYIERIAGAALVVGNDSSAIHIAAATRVPSIVVAAGGNFGNPEKPSALCPYLPYPSDLPDGEFSPVTVTARMDCFGCGHHCRFPAQNDCYPCLAMIRVEQVLEAIANRMPRLSLR